MKVIIAGPRFVNNPQFVAAAIAASKFIITEVVSGHARGVDQLGEDWAREHGVHYTLFPADWNKYGKAAGPRRNEQMAKYADALIAVWDGQSRGTGHMIRTMKNMEKIVYVKRID